MSNDNYAVNTRIKRELKQRTKKPVAAYSTKRKRTHLGRSDTGVGAAERTLGQGPRRGAPAGIDPKPRDQPS